MIIETAVSPGCEMCQRVQSLDLCIETGECTVAQEAPHPPPEGGAAPDNQESGLFFSGSNTFGGSETIMIVAIRLIDQTWFNFRI